MKFPFPHPAKMLPVLGLPCLLLSSCASNAALQGRLDRRNDNYDNLQERREMRQDAREARYDSWWDRAMH